ncbi:hypothetical protein BMS3Abin05_02236 [bacterium BMS3Abin05]|nr:hypothetical protein BMS3Abin05_02236 [bacterium BMS3Abin05]GBE27629.1 hypothetical protein BMS3Bbin03_01557 [bacterium BMS3Bbin03]HDZ12178.1 hypothetical protein [Bacteroidota bacterium]
MLKKKMSNGSFQQAIEEEFVKIMNLGNFESVYLFSEEGLPIIELCGRGIVMADEASEIVLSMSGAVGVLNENESGPHVREVLLLTDDRRKIDIRYFRGLEQPVTLVLVIPPGKTYRSHANRMIRFLSRVETNV